MVKDAQAMRQIRVLPREGATIAEDLEGCVACLGRTGISAHYRKVVETGNGILVLDDASDKKRAARLLRAGGFSIVSDGP